MYLTPYYVNLEEVEFVFKILKTKISRSILKREINFNETKGRA